MRRAEQHLDVIEPGQVGCWFDLEHLRLVRLDPRDLRDLADREPARHHRTLLTGGHDRVADRHRYRQADALVDEELATRAGATPHPERIVGETDPEPEIGIGDQLDVRAIRGDT